MRIDMSRLSELPGTFRRWDSAVFRDATKVQRYFTAEHARLLEAHGLSPLR